MKVDSFTIFQSLKSIMEPYQKALDCTENNRGAFQLYTKYIMPNKKPLYFGGIKINKTFVSYHLMPLYVYPQLTDDMSVELKSLLKGKSCFNVKELNDVILKEFKIITKTCYQKYQSEGYI